jgi:hypothetical protein
MRRVIAALVVVGLAIAVVALWPRSDAGDTAAEATTTTSTTTTEPDPTTTSSTTVPTTSTTSVPDDHVVETVEEAEAILRELWFGWFEGIYYEDEDRIREVVVLEETVETAKESFGLEFERAPEPEDITFAETEILRSDEQCLAVWSVLTTSGFQSGTTDGVYVLRWTNDSWSRLSTWIQRNDLWEADCESTLPG